MSAQEDRIRWLEWTTAVLWFLVGGGISAAVPRLEPVFADFGSELPLVTRLWLWSRPLFMLACAGAAVGAAHLIARSREGARSPRSRRWLWAGVLGALLAAGWSIYAIFAPMYLGTLVGD